MTDLPPLSKDLLDKLTVAKPPVLVRARFIPKDDITAYELATLLPYYLGLRPMFETDWIELGDMTRHLQRIEETNGLV